MDQCRNCAAGLTRVLHELRIFMAAGRTPEQIRIGALRAVVPGMVMTDSTEAESLDSLTEKIIGCAIDVHRALGPGLLESIYRDCLVIEFTTERLRVECDKPVPLTYRGQQVSDLRLDVLVEGCVVVEVKSVAQLHPVHQAQVLTYLKLAGYPVGLLMNFNATTLRAGLKRLVHPDRYVKKQGSENDSGLVIPPSGL